MLSILHECHPFIANYTLGQERVSIADLSLLLTLCWHKHLDSVLAKATRTLNFIRRNKMQDEHLLAVLQMLKFWLIPR